MHSSLSTLGVLMALLVFPLASAAQAQSDDTTAPVSVSAAIEDDVASAQSFVGTVEPARVSIVGSAVAGRVGEFSVREGDRVETNQPLARLLSEQVEIQLEAAKAELALRTAALDELVHGLLPEEIEQAEARYLATQAQWELAKSKLDRISRIERMSTQGIVTADEQHEARAAAQQALQLQLEAKAALELAKMGPRKEKIAQAQANVAVQQQAVRALEDQLRKHTVRAPFDGYVVEQFVDVGQWVPESGSVATIVELDHVEVEAPIPELYIPAVHLKMPAQVEVSALEDRSFDGTVSAIVRRADPIARTFPVKVRLKNRIRGGDVLLNPGMQARIRLPVGAASKATLVPKDAIVLGGRQPLVFVLSQQSQAGLKTVRRVPVELGLPAGGLISIAGELAAGDQVVVQGNERLEDGQAVRVVETIPPENYRPQAAIANR